MASKGQVLEMTQCPVPGCDNAGDNMAIYADGGKYCHACDYTERSQSNANLHSAHYQELKTRGITEETCRFFGCQVAKYNGKLEKRDLRDEWVQVFDYYDNNQKLIRQKIRTKDKEMKLLGAKNDLPLYGQWKWSPNDKLFITITEGEYDAMAIAQVQGYQYPVVSLPLGSNSVNKALTTSLKYLMGFKYVVLAFDNDDAGKTATNKAILLLQDAQIQVRVVDWGQYKDANELLIEGHGSDIKQYIFTAKVSKPENLVTVSDIKDEIMEQPQFGIDYPFESETKITYGFQLGEIHIFVGPNGVGKTEYMTKHIFHFIDKFDLGVALFSFEQKPSDTMRRLVGAKLGLKLHLPGSEWPADKISEVADTFEDKIYLSRSTGTITLDELFLEMRYLAKAKNKKLFIIDNLRGLNIGHDTEKAGIFMTKLQSFCRDNQVTVFLLSHVSKNIVKQSTHVGFSSMVDKPHENLTQDSVKATMNKFKLNWNTGRMPDTTDIDGPSVIGDLANYIWGLARNRDSENPREARTIEVKPIKTRLDGSKTGKTFKVYYTDSGTLIEDTLQVDIQLTAGKEPF